MLFLDINVTYFLNWLTTYHFWNLYLDYFIMDFFSFLFFLSLFWVSKCLSYMYYIFIRDIYSIWCKYLIYPLSTFQKCLFQISPHSSCRMVKRTTNTQSMYKNLSILFPCWLIFLFLHCLESQPPRKLVSVAVAAIGTYGD